MKAFFIAAAAFMSLFLSACGGPPKTEVTGVVDLGTSEPWERMMIVSDLSKKAGQKIQTAFNGKFLEMANPGIKPVEFISYIDFIKSPYNKPDVNDSFSKCLFVFITTRGTNTYQYFVSSFDYLLEVKYLGYEPFLVQKIKLNMGDPYFTNDQQRGAELARAIAEELKKRKIL
jgi:hypothetical protein